MSNAAMIPDAIGKIITEAFTPAAGVGGLIGVLVQGFKRAAFSSEAGIGSAAIAHATAKVKYPVRQGIVALMEPFIDTIVICTMTALVIIITGVYNSPETVELVANREGAALTAVAFGTAISWFPIILSISVVLVVCLDSTTSSWFVTALQDVRSRMKMGSKNHTYLRDFMNSSLSKLIGRISQRQLKPGYQLTQSNI